MASQSPVNHANGKSTPLSVLAKLRLERTLRFWNNFPAHNRFFRFIPLIKVEEDAQ